MTTTVSHHQSLARRSEQFLQAVAENRGWFTFLGIVTLLAGVGALLFPVASSIAVELFVGFTFAVVGLAQIVHAFGNRSWGGFFLGLLVGIIYAAVGFFLIAKPAEGTAALTLAVALAFLFNGVAQTVWSFQMMRHSGLMLVSGLVSLVLGIMLMANFPFDAEWVLGAFVGINFLFSGISMIALSVAAGDVENRAKSVPSSA